MAQRSVNALDGEGGVVVRVGAHWTQALPGALWAALCVAVSFALYRAWGAVSLLGVYCAVLPLLAGVAVVLGRARARRRVLLAVTRDGVVCRGPGRRDGVRELALEQVRGVYAERGALGRRLGFGRVRVRVHGAPDWSSPVVASPQEVCRALVEVKAREGG